MAAFSEFLPLLREKCSGMLEVQALDQLKKAYRNFCIESGYVQLTETVSVATDGTIELSPTTGYFVLQINTVDDSNGDELKKGADYKVSSRNKVTVNTSYSSVEVTYSIAPTLPLDASVTVDDDVFNRWPDEIAAGAAALLRVMPRQTWTDVGLSDFYNQDFIKGYREAYRARIDASDERQLQTQSTRDFF